MLTKIKEVIASLDSLSKNKPIKVISHFDTDGITSAAIFSRALQRWGKKFSLQIVKGLDEEFIKNLPETHILIFVDLASGSLDYLAKKKTEVFIFDHHQVVQEIPKNVTMVNPEIDNYEQISGASICYLFAKALGVHNEDLATLAVLGMVGDTHEKDLGKTYTEIIQDSGATIKKGILIYPSTRPIDRALEYSSNPYIPGVTGSYTGVLELLRDTIIKRENGRFKALYELTEEEMRSLVTAIAINNTNAGAKASSELIGNLYLIKFFNKLEDARELSALVNACSRMDCPEISLGFCLGNAEFKQKAEKLYIEYKQHLVSALKFVNEMDKIKGPKYEIINAKDNVKDTIIGTVASIISRSHTYEEGTVIIALAYSKDKIKISARLAGREGHNVREVLTKVVVPLGGEVGGHPNAAGCIIEKDQEEQFIEQIKKTLEIQKIESKVEA